MNLTFVNPPSFSYNQTSNYCLILLCTLKGLGNGFELRPFLNNADLDKVNFTVYYIHTPYVFTQHISLK